MTDPPAQTTPPPGPLPLVHYWQAMYVCMYSRVHRVNLKKKKTAGGWGLGAGLILLINYSSHIPTLPAQTLAVICS